MISGMSFFRFFSPESMSALRNLCGRTPSGELIVAGILVSSSPYVTCTNLQTAYWWNLHWETVRLPTVVCPVRIGSAVWSTVIVYVALTAECNNVPSAPGAFLWPLTSAVPKNSSGTDRRRQGSSFVVIHMFHLPRKVCDRVNRMGSPLLVADCLNFASTGAARAVSLGACTLTSWHGRFQRRLFCKQSHGIRRRGARAFRC